jgi:hypothetical protein
MPRERRSSGRLSGLLFRVTAAWRKRGIIMRFRTLLVTSAAAAAMWGVPQIASADVVGVPGTPNCFGQRISHGSSDHDLTPKERAAGLQELVDAGVPEAVALFGPTVSVQEMIKFVQANCSDDPIVPTP